MEEALKEAQKALESGEVPIGSVVVWKDRIVGRGHNLKESSGDPTAHAEFMALRDASRMLGGWRLLDSTIYVTLEPCLMCMGAIIQARVPKLVFGCFDPKAGACGSLYNLSEDKRLNHRMEVLSHVKSNKSEALLKSFFNNLRVKENCYNPVNPCNFLS